MDIKQQVALLVRQVDGLKNEIDTHWIKAKKHVDSGRIDDAARLLIAYFSLKQNLEVAEGQLSGILRGHFEG